MSADKIILQGVVTESSRGVARVEVEIGEARRVVLAKLCGHMQHHHIRVLPGDRVTVEVSPYDLTRGRITERERAAS
jgi:translation initiation factor IF-1